MMKTLTLEQFTSYPNREDYGPRTANTLKEKGILEGCLLFMDESQLLRLSNIGRKTLNEIKEGLQKKRMRYWSRSKNRI